MAAVKAWRAFVGLGILGASLAFACGGSISAQPKQLSISDVHANFTVADYSTHYVVDIRPGANSPIARWSLRLQLIDASGAPDPNIIKSMAAVDGRCDNDGVGVASPYEDRDAEQSMTARFTWVHAGVRGAAGEQGVPTGPNAGKYAKYRCDHAKSGPRGHQGVVTVVVSDGVLLCTASYLGSNSGYSSDAGQPGPPTCSQI